MPPYKPVPFKGFGGGLNLRDAPEVVAEDQAIDSLNTIHSQRGAVEQRSGYAKLTSAELTNRADSMSEFYKTDGTKQIVVGNGNRLTVISAAGSVVAEDTAGITANPHFFQRFGGPTGEDIYIANGTDTVQKWNGSAFSVPAYPAVTPNGKFLGLSVTDNRLVNARFTGTTAGNNPSTVRFSAEGDPISFATTHYVDLNPGDGEEITGIAVWRDQLIVFKSTKFYVFYGNSVDDDGEPVFNYRPVDAGVGLVSPRALAVSEQGVYFLDRTGIYFTSGSQPERVSDVVEPIFHGHSWLYYTGGVLNDASIGDCTMQYHDERLFFSFPAGVSADNDRQLVFDPHEKWWALWDLPAGPMISFRIGDVEELVFGYSTGLKHLGRYVDGARLTDNQAQDGSGGVAISSHWRSGWFNFDTIAVKWIREQKIAGSGQVSVGMSRDYKQLPSWSVVKVLSPGAPLYNDGNLYNDGHLYGPSGQITTKMIRKGIRGERFSVILSNSEEGKTYRVTALTNNLGAVRVPTMVST